MSTPFMPICPVAPLFVPGDRSDRFTKAAQSGADAVIIDLEDAVAPERKAQARAEAATHNISGVPVFIRINAADTEWFDDDLAMISRANVSGVVIPKAESAEITERVARKAGVRQIIPLIETAKGIAALNSLLSCEGISCAAFGSLDLALDLGCAPDWEPLLTARCELVLRSRLAGIAPPLDGITPALDNLDETRADARRARALGFHGKLAIHPRQIDPILAAFSPTPDERAWAQAVLTALANQPPGAFKIDGVLVDRPVVERARRIMARGLA